MLTCSPRYPRALGIATWPCCRASQRDCSFVQVDAPAFQRGPDEVVGADRLSKRSQVIPYDTNTGTLPAPQGSWVRYLAAPDPGCPGALQRVRMPGCPPKEHVCVSFIFTVFNVIKIHYIIYHRLLTCFPLFK
jgi:hypothetical protein